VWSSDVDRSDFEAIRIRDLKLFELITIRQHVALRNREKRWRRPILAKSGLWPVV
jgi:hypothetical protein